MDESSKLEHIYELVGIYDLLMKELMNLNFKTSVLPNNGDMMVYSTPSSSPVVLSPKINEVYKTSVIQDEMVQDSLTKIARYRDKYVSLAEKISSPVVESNEEVRSLQYI